MKSDMPYVWAALPLVVAVIIAFIVWRSARKERSRRRLREELASPSAAVRRQTLEQVDDDALARNAALLCEFLESERDPDVLDALAAAVARSRWEPTDDGNIVELRRWVAGRHAHLPLVSPVAPVLPSADEHTDAPHDAPARVEAPEPAALDAADEVHEPAPPAGAESAGTGGVLVAQRTTMLEPMAPVDLAELVGKVRELLGEGLARMEFVSIDGEVLSTWHAPDATEATAPRDHEDASRPTS